MKRKNYSAWTKNFLLLISTIFFLFLNSCSNPTELDENFLMSQVPVIKGINITSRLSGGSGEVITWRKPDYSPDEKYTNQRLNMSNPYPNPSSTWIRIEFTIQNTEQVSLWLSKGVLPEEISGEKIIQSTGGASLISGADKKSYVIKLFENEPVSGPTGITWYGLNEERQEAPGGFYRVYLKIGKILLWRDILFARSAEDAPSELRHYLTFYE
jgi:hypothetical protein